MKEIKINTEQELDMLLKALSESAVRKSKALLHEDKYRDKFIKKYDNEMKNLIGEQDEEAEEEPAEEEEAEETPAEDEEATGEDEAEDVAAEDEEAEEPAEPAENPATKKAKEYEEYDSEYKASYEDIKDAINILRAGRSLKDEEISQELNDYYKVLDKDERAVLLLFLRELSKILTGAIEGEEAQDPSNPSTYFKIEKIENDEGKDVKDVDQDDEKADQPQPKPKAQPVDIEATGAPTGGEDTSPPIKVNEAQDFTNFKKIRD